MKREGNSGNEDVAPEGVLGYTFGRRGALARERVSFCDILAG